MRIQVVELSLAVAAAALLLACGPGTREVMSSSPAISAAGNAERSMNVAQSGAGAMTEAHLAREVRHELVMLPYYGVFDNLAYRINGGTVTLTGQVTNPSLKSDAQNVVQNIEGVTQVVNDITVLPASPDDDRLRLNLYHAIYADTTLSRYALQAVPPIHIIVSNGRATLEGVVATEADMNMAGLRANGVPGVLSVTNNLRVGS
jgi:hyperosmotically inducible protein